MSGPTYTMAYGFAPDGSSETGGATTGSRSRDDDDDGSNPQPKSMPGPLSRQVDRPVAMEVAMKMADDRDARGAQPSSSMEPPTLGIMNNGNFYLSSVPMPNFFCIMPVPKAPDALDDYRWDLLMQGIGPENVVVHNCRGLSNNSFATGSSRTSEDAETFEKPTESLGEVSERQHGEMD